MASQERVAGRVRPPHPMFPVTSLFPSPILPVLPAVSDIDWGGLLCVLGDISLQTDTIRRFGHDQEPQRSVIGEPFESEVPRGERKRAIRESYLSTSSRQWMRAGYLEDIWVIYEGGRCDLGKPIFSHFTTMQRCETNAALTDTL
ncbi:hypothetical protein EYF80_011786 [Liparis tanakae]|uniref:Uncharacterized protein n=1 Tax=Liparis tanakae TaxID=230148 RepID=A0A4Z2ILF5_9TELE|nr:hypothetical protein EYF80_011786 [Liparis tanakae]